jgi:hypothetical protein
MRIALCSLILLLCSCSLLPANDGSQVEIGEVELVDGQPRALRDDRYFEIGERTSIVVKDTIITGVGEKVRLVMADGAIIVLGPSTQFVFHVYSDSKPTPIARMSSSTGTYRIQSGKLVGKPGSRFEVATAQAQLTLKEGEVWVGRSDREDTVQVILMSEGEVLVSNQFAAVQLSKPGQGSLITFNAPPETPRTWLRVDIDTLVEATNFSVSSD